MGNQQLKWFYLIALALLWGSSFILIKRGLVGLSPLQLGSFRVALCAIVLIIIGFKKIKQIKSSQWKWIGISGLIGSLLPTFLFAYAETEIDSAVAAILNSTVPLLALIVGLFFFGTAFIKKQFIGVVVGLVGSIALILAGASLNPDQNYWYGVLPVIASLMYAFNANIIKSYLGGISALGIATGSFVILFFPAMGILVATDFFNEAFLAKEEVQVSLLYVAVLAILGTALAKIIFNRLIQLSDPVFSTSVTYLIPVVALFWGLLDGEEFSLLQLAAGGIILVGVYLSNKKKRLKKKL
ncbi:DMT family transporter [Psychroflexus planctonicus]|uniref:Permease n=1 Tax=Psychroflexus planctonicus TaxID=1526575 RepID=A0ABQ1SHR8_9FLAO|nr:DMT family transporter [Psychroflexus planctonicus]GGE40653.1 permease [Psychroflexus planctonicus]